MKNIITLEKQKLRKSNLKSFLVNDVKYGLRFISKLYHGKKEIILDCISMDNGNSIHLPIFTPINKSFRKE